MPNITSSGTYTKNTEGFGFLGKSINPRTLKSYKRTLLFAGSSLGTACTVQYTDDEGVDHTLADGTITTIPTSIIIDPAPVDLKIVVTGSPTFNITGG